MELVLIRHALPEREMATPGATADPPLTLRGREQAERLARWCEAERWDALYASPLRRARETAQPLLHGRGLDLRLCEGVAEFDRDSAVYVPLDQLKRENPERWRELVRGGWYVEHDIGAFRRRVVEALEELIARHAGQRIAVVCHGGVINAWTAQVLGLESAFLFEPDYTSVSRFVAARSGERSLRSLNEAAHLRDLD